MTQYAIIFNGTSSSGKTTLAKQLLEKLHEPFLLLSLDTYLESLEPPQWITSELWHEKFPESSRIQGYHASILAIWKEKISIIIDHVFVNPSWKAELHEIFSSDKIVFIGVHCSLKELEAREQERGDRIIGLAKYQFNRVHKNCRYDCEVDTSKSTPKECIEIILASIASKFPDLNPL